MFISCRINYVRNNVTARTGYLCITSLNTSSILRIGSCINVTCCRNFCLCNLVVASCTMRTFSKTGFLALRSNCRIGNHIVTECLDFFLALNVIATRTILICCITGIQAICCLTFYINEIVTES